MQRKVSSGFLLVDKPAGTASHDVIDRLRKITGERTIGHAGTLDPFATGLLIVAIGREATKNLAKFSRLDKTYEAEFALGATTETLDPEASLVPQEPPVVPLKNGDIERAMQALTGDIEQIPPMYAAIKVKGKKLYEMARKGETIERAPRRVRIDAFELLAPPREEGDLTLLDVRIRCSSGTYIRALARDLAERLGTVGYVRALRRTAIGAYKIEDAMRLVDIDETTWKQKLFKQTTDV